MYRLIPFVSELRSILDWVCADTSLDMCMWMQCDDLYGALYLVKVSARAWPFVFLKLPLLS